MTESFHERARRFMIALEGLEGIERVQAWMDLSTKHFQEHPDSEEWTSSILPHITIHSHSSAPPPNTRIVFRMRVTPAHCSLTGSMHGGCTATLFDHLTTLPLLLIQRPGFWTAQGVSRTLSVTYLRPVELGSTVEVECEVVQAGRNLCALRGTMRALPGGDGRPGAVLALCEHGKVNTDGAGVKL